MTDGWDESAQAWIRDMGEHGDFGRRYVLDPVMLDMAVAGPATRVLDVGCGEGRFCRMLRARGIDSVGLDPTSALLDHAVQMDPDGVYVEGRAEALPFAEGAFDLVVSYVTFVDIPDIRAAIPEMARVLAPGGRVLVANVNAFVTAGMELGWMPGASGDRRYFAIDRYQEERAVWTEWRGIRIINHHRPLSVYMQLFIEQGLQLTHFSEPTPTPDAPAERAARNRRVPWFHVMEWSKPLIAPSQTTSS